MNEERGSRWRTSPPEKVYPAYLELPHLRGCYFRATLVKPREVTMNPALIAVAAAGFLTSTAWVVAANAQANINPNVYPGNMGERYGARAPAYTPAPAYGPSRRYARRAYRRSARPSYGAPGAPPGTYAGNTAFTPGSGGQPYAVTPGSYA